MKHCGTGSYSIIILFILILCPGYSKADPLNNWHLREPSGVQLTAVVFANDIFVAVGGNGTILTSPDGTTWTARTSGTTDYLEGVTYGNGTFVAVGIHGTVLTSRDGTTWSASALTSTFFFTGVTYGNGTFVATGGSGQNTIGFFTSVDGMNWTMRVPGLSLTNLSGITYGNGRFVAVGYGTVLTSADGVSWTAGNGGNLDPLNGALNGVTYGNGYFVAVGGSRSLFTLAPSFGTILTSPEGANWTLRFSTSDSTVSFFGATYGNGTFIAVGFDGTSGAIMTSSDGISWDRRVSIPGSSLSGVAFGNNTFVAVGSGILQSDPLSGLLSPFVKANNSSGIVTLTTTDPLSLTVSLDASGFSALNADWWVVISTQCGFFPCWYCYMYPNQWQFAFDLADVKPAYQGPIFSFNSFEVLRLPGSLPGTYSVYFGVDTNMNGRIDFDLLRLDYVLINVVP